MAPAGNGEDHPRAGHGPPQRGGQHEHSTEEGSERSLVQNTTMMAVIVRAMIVLITVIVWAMIVLITTMMAVIVRAMIVLIAGKSRNPHKQ